MTPKDKPSFMQLMTDAMAFYRQDVSNFALGVWWEACKGFDLEQVTKAITAHAMDPERGQFAPKPADVVRQLQGTRTDRSLVAWGKVLDAMQRVGAYTSVVFDDGLIHAVVEDLGGWVEMCRGELKDLPHVERRFCESYRAYVAKGDVQFPAMLPGVHQLQNAMNGRKSAPPVLIGNPDAARQVAQIGSDAPKTQITHVRESFDQLRIGVTQ
jgi:hypothetical protein